MPIQANAPVVRPSCIPSEWVQNPSAASAAARSCVDIPTPAAGKSARSVQSERRGQAPPRPAEPQAAPPAEDAFADLGTGALARSRRSSTGLSLKSMARGVLWTVGLIGIVAIVYVLATGKHNQKVQVVILPDKDSVQPETPPPVATGPFPRRLLAINICNYLYFDPISPGAGGGWHTILTKSSPISSKSPADSSWS